MLCTNPLQKASGGSLDFNLISLFPPTWNNRPNGMRRDLMQALKDLGPVSFVILVKILICKHADLLEIPPFPWRKQPGGSNH